jgi:hypothetical protein
LPPSGCDLGCENEDAARLADIRRCSEATDRVLAGLRRGRLPLGEAAALFRDIARRSADPARRTQLLRLLIRGRSDAGRYCRKVIDNVSRGEGDRPANGGAARRLERELEAYLRRHGTVRLPGVPAD